MSRFFSQVQIDLAASTAYNDSAPLRFIKGIIPADDGDFTYNDTAGTEHTIPVLKGISPAIQGKFEILATNATAVTILL